MANNRQQFTLSVSNELMIILESVSESAGISKAEVARWVLLQGLLELRKDLKAK